jgi:hypothetical protein
MADEKKPWADIPKTNKALEKSVTNAAKLEKLLTSKKGQAAVKQLGAEFSSLASDIVNLGKTIANVMKNQLFSHINSVTQAMNDLAGVDLTNLLSFQGQLSTITSTTKSLVDEQIAWEQQLISTYKPLAEVSKGSKEIYSTLVSTTDTLDQNMLDWMEIGGAAEGINLAVAYMSNTLDGMKGITNETLKNWREQNLALGISTEHSAKIASFQERSGMSLEQSLDFQREIFGVLKKQFKSNGLTSKMIESIADSEWAILNYSKGNVIETARIAANAHAWNMSIDEIYATAHKLSKAEQAIEMSRKAQLMFGMNINARQMQYMAQMGKEGDLVEYLVDQFKEQSGSFDDLSLSQKQFIADSIAGGNIIKARTMLLGREEQIQEDMVDPVKTQTDLMKEQNELLKAQTDQLATFQSLRVMERTALWEEWRNHLTWIFGAETKNMQASDMALKLEEARVYVLQKAFLPIMEKIGGAINSALGGSSLIGTSLTDGASALNRFLEAMKPVQEFVTAVGTTIVEWWFKNGLDRVGKIVEFLNSEEGGKALADTITRVGDAVLIFVENFVKGHNVLEGIQWMFDKVADAITFIADTLPTIIYWMLGLTAATKLWAMWQARGAVWTAVSSAAKIPWVGWLLAGAAAAGIFALGTAMGMSIAGGSSSMPAPEKPDISKYSPSKKDKEKFKFEEEDLDTSSYSSSQMASSNDRDEKLAKLIAQEIYNKLTVPKGRAQLDRNKNVLPVKQFS